MVLGDAARTHCMNKHELFYTLRGGKPRFGAVYVLKREAVMLFGEKHLQSRAGQSLDLWDLLCLLLEPQGPPNGAGGKIVAQDGMPTPKVKEQEASEYRPETNFISIFRTKFPVLFTKTMPAPLPPSFLHFISPI